MLAKQQYSSRRQYTFIQKQQYSSRHQYTFSQNSSTAHAANTHLFKIAVQLTSPIHIYPKQQYSSRRQYTFFQLQIEKAEHYESICGWECLQNVSHFNLNGNQVNFLLSILYHLLQNIIMPIIDIKISSLYPCFNICISYCRTQV